MLPALVGTIATQLFQNNLPKVAQAVLDKGIDAVSEKLGFELKPDMSAEELAAVKERAMQHEEFMVEQANKNTADARAMNTAAMQSSDPLVRRFTIYLTTFWSIVGSIYIFWITFGNIPVENTRFADTVLGFLLGTVVATMLNFWLGSSAGSKEKDTKK
jgi:hypothetical protein